PLFNGPLPLQSGTFLSAQLEFLIMSCLEQVTAHTNIPLAMLIVFTSAKLMAELFERLGQPGLVGEILAGVLIGPSVLHWIAPTDFLTALSDLGAMFLLFRVGLEVKSSELFKLGGTATLVAVSGGIVPFLMGWGFLLVGGRAT